MVITNNNQWKTNIWGFHGMYAYASEYMHTYMHIHVWMHAYMHNQHNDNNYTWSSQNCGIPQIFDSETVEKMTINHRVWAIWRLARVWAITRIKGLPPPPTLEERKLGGMVELVEVPRKGERCGQRKFRSQISAKMGRWNSRGGKGQRGEGKKREEQRTDRARRKNMSACHCGAKHKFQVRVCKTY